MVLFNLNEILAFLIIKLYKMISISSYIIALLNNNNTFINIIYISYININTINLGKI